MLNWIVFNRTDYLHKMDLALNNLQRLICHKTQQIYSYTKVVELPGYLTLVRQSVEEKENSEFKHFLSVNR